MAKSSNKSKVPPSLARPVITAVAPAANGPKKKAPRPAKKRDAADVDRAESEGMGQPQGLPVKKNSLPVKKKGPPVKKTSLPAQKKILPAVAPLKLAGAQGKKAIAAKPVLPPPAKMAKKATKKR